MDEVRKLENLNDMLKGFGGKPLDPQYGPDGKELPEDQQLTLGNVMLTLVATMDPEGSAKGVMLQRRVADRIFGAMDADPDTYEAGPTALGILKRAAEQNKPGYRILVLSAVHAALGVTADD